MKTFKKYFFGVSMVTLSVGVISYLSLALFIASFIEKDTALKSDAILVLGARSYKNGKYNPCLEKRVNHAAKLYNEGYASKIVVTGGNDIEDNINEAETIKKIAVEKGVASEDILEEKAATSTYENFKLSQDILARNNLHSVIIVTEPFHMARASLIAKKLGYDFTMSPAPDSPCWTTWKYLSRYFLKEPLVIAIYKIQGKL